MLDRGGPCSTRKLTILQAGTERGPSGRLPGHPTWAVNFFMENSAKIQGRGWDVTSQQQQKPPLPPAGERRPRQEQALESDPPRAPVPSEPPKERVRRELPGVCDTPSPFLTLLPEMHSGSFQPEHGDVFNADLSPTRPPCWTHMCGSAAGPLALSPEEGRPEQGRVLRQAPRATLWTPQPVCSKEVLSINSAEPREEAHSAGPSRRSTSAVSAPLLEVARGSRGCRHLCNLLVKSRSLCESWVVPNHRGTRRERPRRTQGHPGARGTGGPEKGESSVCPQGHLGSGPRRWCQYGDFVDIRVLSPVRSCFINFSD